MIPAAALMHSWNNEVSEDCFCCDNPRREKDYFCYDNPRRETISHLFLRNKTATKVWDYYYAGAGITEQRLKFKRCIRIWRK